MNVSDIFGQSPAERNAAMRAAGQPTHLGPRLPAAEAPTATSRAKTALDALYAKLPAPKWGKRSA